MDRPNHLIEELRKATQKGIIDPDQEYRFDLGNGEFYNCTGQEMLDTASIFLEFADAERDGNVDKMKKILDFISK